MTEDEYKSFVKKWREFYNTIKRVSCRYLGVNVIFNSHGFNHLLYDGHGRTRSPEDVVRRLILLPYAASVIGLAQSFNERRTEAKGQSWSFRRRIDKKWIKVVIRKIGNGNTTFISIM